MSDKAVAAAAEAEAEDGAAEGKEVVRIPCLVYSRIVGYLRPIKYWGPGKKQEFEDRIDYLQP